MLLFLVALPEVIIDPHHSSLQPFKCRDILVTKPQLVANAIWDGIFHYLPERPVIPTDAILELGKLNKIIDGLAIVGEGNRDDGIFIVILW